MQANIEALERRPATGRMGIAAARGTAVADRRSRVLLVDDDAHHREIFADAIGEDGFRVDLAASGPEALARIAREAPDVVVLDLGMPGMSGLETLDRIHERSPRLKVILHTAYSCAPGGPPRWPVAAYVVKSADPHELLDRIRCALA